MPREKNLGLEIIIQRIKANHIVLLYYGYRNFVHENK